MTDINPSIILRIQRTTGIFTTRIPPYVTGRFPFKGTLRTLSL